MTEINLFEKILLIESKIDEALGMKKRVRNGGKTVQRRFRFSKIKDRSYNNASKKERRMTVPEKIRRKRAQKLAAKKRISSKHQANISRNRSNRKRKSLGFDK